MDNEAVARLAGSAVAHGSSDDPDALDFSANVNPEVPDGVAQVYAGALDGSRTYPPEDYLDYRRAAAGYVDCDADAVIPTAGGLAAIRLAVAVTVDPGDRVLVPEPSFGEYAREVELQGGEPVAVAHDAVLSADPSEFALAIVCNPNNPTGDAYEPSALADFADRCRAAGTVLLVDEAFLGFTDRPSLAGEPGVVVARSLTKLFGLPGLRAGFAVATGDLGERVRTAAITWGLGWPAAAVGAHCMDSPAFVAETRDRVASERERLRAAFDADPRFSVHRPDSPTEDATAPFLLLDCGSDEGVEELLSRARAAGIELRDARSFAGLDTHVRVAVRTPAEHDRLLGALDVRE
ncbi:aminotransferase class I/II-fold pyridoxal phosphate-dependent enzyme [Halosimplex pelagicum]|uniref:Aminotransferase n=1 Tax=Halosimplex pelagicum TaxID=869886 RepID=A0A7D5TGI6_9EURY|nr:aminotransferase class I/II-fold pyridoxal phosphate-dependent enzyme [Halosimplex pelagicum]QLH81656.1 pyridoxal phosphate-dependent class II aminotransferase [Halosimplex pelagicum]